LIVAGTSFGRAFGNGCGIGHPIGVIWARNGYHEVYVRFGRNSVHDVVSLRLKSSCGGRRPHADVARRIAKRRAAPARKKRAEEAAAVKSKQIILPEVCEGSRNDRGLLFRSLLKST